MGTKHLTPINNRDLHASIGLGIYDKEILVENPIIQLEKMILHTQKDIFCCLASWDMNNGMR